MRFVSQQYFISLKVRKLNETWYVVDEQDMRWVLVVFLTHLWPGTRAVCFLWLQACCGFVAQTWGPKCSECGWWSSGSSVYTGSMSLTTCSVTASIAAAHRDPFSSYGTQWLNDCVNVCCFIAGVCGLQVCTSRSEQQVSHCDTCVCLRGWNKCVVCCL